MTEEEYSFYKARVWAAERYSAKGNCSFADRVERGLEDDCSQVRLGQFFTGPPYPHDPAFIVAWDELANVVTT